MTTWIGLLVFIYSFISSIFFLSNSNTLNVLSHSSVRPTKLKLDTHMGKGMIYCVHQIQAASIYLFLYFSSFFLYLQLAKIKNLYLQIFHFTSNGYGRGYMSFAHSLLYLGWVKDLIDFWWPWPFFKFTSWQIVITSLACTLSASPIGGFWLNLHGYIIGREVRSD